mmetsp:Transcript_19841/g.42829  ORF Transcript_19841/g.42829 Transcript_19841/m.42829 type:complete len:206 (-) Transcript_19841:39-656(-)
MRAGVTHAPLRAAERVQRMRDKCLQLLEERVVLLLSGLELRLEVLEHLGAVLGRHVNVRLQLSLLLVAAVLHRIDGAARAKLSRELLQIGKRAAALVVLALLIRRIEVLDGGEALDAVLIAKRLPGGCAVDVGNQHLVRRLVLGGKRVPVRLHLLAVPAPWCKEFDEGRFARLEDLVLKGVRRQLEGRGGGRNSACEGNGTEHFS